MLKASDYSTVIVDVLRPTVNVVRLVFDVAPATGTNYFVIVRAVST
jgi:hypothetical protein